ncbi:hypothetical protein [Bacillus velezensis]|uniref:hypothetical protein n=1 Tax=Bacillus velezensis TaxID=492670 RepID=UPI001E408A16|nr:hypothetical protein [Bacillus velezensis]
MVKGKPELVPVEHKTEEGKPSPQPTQVKIKFSPLTNLKKERKDGKQRRKRATESTPKHGLNKLSIRTSQKRNRLSLMLVNNSLSA